MARRNLLSIACSLFSVATLSTVAAAGGQQQYANAYTDWNFGQAKDIWNIDQQIWIPVTANASQWVLVWKWTLDEAHGGYLGFNTDEKKKAQAIFSLWNGDSAKGPNCMEFDGEGAGYSCRKTFALDSAKYYRLRLWRLNADDKGQWWGAWIIEEDKNGKLVEHALGSIRVEKKFDTVHPRSGMVQNFSEYFGDSVAECGAVPSTIAVFTPPAANYKGAGTGAYSFYSKYAARNHSKNPCVDGKEPEGAMFTVKEHELKNLGTKGAIISLGGNPPSNLPAGTLEPKDMPDS
jgi:hypothetical protein